MDIEWNAIPIDADLDTPEQIESIFSISVYNKAPSILHMLSNIVTPEVFRKGLISYLDKHEFDSADPDCLWTALQNALNESDVPHSDFNLKEVMETWIEQRRYPLVTVERNYSTGDVTLRQEDYVSVHDHKHVGNTFFKDDNETYQWWVPITYTTESDLNFDDTRTKKWLRPNEVQTLDEIDPDDWIIVNKKQSGYYRVNYDEANWRKIAKYLRSENFSKIDVLCRAQIINDITELVIYNRVDRSVFLDLLLYMKQEEDYPPWSHLFEKIEDFQLTLQYPSAKPIKDFMLSLMENLLKDIGYDDDPNDSFFTMMKRGSALQAACRLGHDECIEMAAVKMAEYLDNPNMKISQELSKWMYQNGGRRANESLWYKMLESCEKYQVTHMLSAMSCTENLKLFEAYLNLSISDNSTISNDCNVNIIGYAFGNPLFLDVTIDFCLRNYEKLNKSLNTILYNIDFPLNEGRLEMLKLLCTRQKDCEMEKFMKHLSDTNDVERGIEKWIIAINNINGYNKSDIV